MEKRELTGADPIPNAWEPFGVSRGVVIDEKTRLLTPVAERPESIVPVPASATFPKEDTAVSNGGAETRRIEGSSPEPERRGRAGWSGGGFGKWKGIVGYGAKQRA
ncbi:LOW QUALITY PROTEIN: hypothetical protein TorRG33x02_046420 [Trema orientale]|uniref:Uncharacterized protein n=1 Tax=Trema orientale TaxID=63057 RepID=A0A2P5FNV0_TREOI|nr:LOW QUALITY PROTEIN: hypothetical protein TorRG33x02_046420 [Trema orientale]